MNDFGGRKFLLTGVVVLLVFVLAFTNQVKSGDFVEFIKWALGFYIGGNVLSDFVKK